MGPQPDGPQDTSRDRADGLFTASPVWQAAGALFELADDAGNRIGITEAGGIGPLVTLWGSSNSQARRHAEGALVRA